MECLLIRIKRLMTIIFAFNAVLLMDTVMGVKPECQGQFINPITHVCWKCMFPLTIGGFKVADPDKDLATPTEKRQVFCKCGDPIPRIGIPIGFWEPFRVVDVSLKPYCMVTLGGVTMDLGMKPPSGTITEKRGGHTGTREAFYHLHWYVYPLLVWMNLITGLLCMTTESFDLAYLTELDPLWDDDELALWLNPEAVLFANPIAELACSADCASASFGTALNPLFWCAGCRGGVFPLTGHLNNHTGGVNSSTFIIEKMIFKLHRELLLHGSMGIKGLCGLYPMPWWKKEQYKLQMTYPKVSKTSQLSCNPIGRTTSIWGSNKEYPVKGEDFGYIIWRRRSCCVY